MIISRFWNISRLLKLVPGHFLGIKFEGIFALGIILNTTEDHSFMSEYSCLMMGNVSWDLSFLVDGLPLNTGIAMHSKVLKSTQVNSPHAAHWTNFNISTAVNVKMLINNETTVIRSSLREFALKSNFTPLIIL